MTVKNLAAAALAVALSAGSVAFAQTKPVRTQQTAPAKNAMTKTATKTTVTKPVTKKVTVTKHVKTASAPAKSTNK